MAYVAAGWILLTLAHTGVALGDSALPTIPQPIQELAHPRPTYPESALRAGIVGTVLVMFDIAPGGKVTSLRVVQSVPGLDEAVLRCARQWTFSSTATDTESLLVDFNFSFGDSAGGQRRLHELFREHLAELRRLGPNLTRASAPLRERIIREGYSVDPYPEIPMGVIASIRRADSLNTLANRLQGRERERMARALVAEAMEAIEQAPWENDSYRLLADGLQLLGRAEEEALSLEIFISGEVDYGAIDRAQKRIDLLRNRSR